MLRNTSKRQKVKKHKTKKLKIKRKRTSKTSKRKLIKKSLKKKRQINKRKKKYIGGNNDNDKKNGNYAFENIRNIVIENNEKQTFLNLYETYFLTVDENEFKNIKNIYNNKNETKRGNLNTVLIGEKTTLRIPNDFFNNSTKFNFTKFNQSNLILFLNSFINWKVCEKNNLTPTIYRYNLLGKKIDGSYCGNKALIETRKETVLYDYTNDYNIDMIWSSIIKLSEINIIHLDIKTTNIIITSENIIQFIDLDADFVLRISFIQQIINSFNKNNNDNPLISNDKIVYEISQLLMLIIFMGSSIIYTEKETIFKQQIYNNENIKTKILNHKDSINTLIDYIFNIQDNLTFLPLIKIIETYCNYDNNNIVSKYLEIEENFLGGSNNNKKEHQIETPIINTYYNNKILYDVIKDSKGNYKLKL